MKYYPVIWGLFHKPLYMRILIKQPVFDGKYPSFLFSWLRCVLTPNGRTGGVFVVGICSSLAKDVFESSNLLPPNLWNKTLKWHFVTFDWIPWGENQLGFSPKLCKKSSSYDHRTTPQMRNARVLSPWFEHFDVFCCPQFPGVEKRPESTESLDMYRWNIAKSSYRNMCIPYIYHFFSFISQRKNVRMRCIANEDKQLYTFTFLLFINSRFFQVSPRSDSPDNLNKTWGAFRGQLPHCVCERWFLLTFWNGHLTIPYLEDHPS